MRSSRCCSGPHIPYLIQQCSSLTTLPSGNPCPRVPCQYQRICHFFSLCHQFYSLSFQSLPTHTTTTRKLIPTPLVLLHHNVINLLPFVMLLRVASLVMLSTTELHSNFSNIVLSLDFSYVVPEVPSHGSLFAKIKLPLAHNVKQKSSPQMNAWRQLNPSNFVP